MEDSYDSPLLAGDRVSEPVLRELAHDPCPRMQLIGNWGLRNIADKQGCLFTCAPPNKIGE